MDDIFAEIDNIAIGDNGINFKTGEKPLIVVDA